MFLCLLTVSFHTSLSSSSLSPSPIAYKDWNECMKLLVQSNSAFFTGEQYCNVLRVLFTKELYCTPKSQYTTVKHSQKLFSNSNTRTTSTGSLTQLLIALRTTSELFKLSHHTITIETSLLQLLCY
jgi:hypothetical protein